jgi:hypothetical protein
MSQGPEKTFPGAGMPVPQKRWCTKCHQVGHLCEAVEGGELCAFCEDGEYCPVIKKKLKEAREAPKVIATESPLKKVLAAGAAKKEESNTMAPKITDRVCALEGCTTQLASNNRSGYCGPHFYYSKKKSGGGEWRGRHRAGGCSSQRAA